MGLTRTLTLTLTLTLSLTLTLTLTLTLALALALTLARRVAVEFLVANQLRGLIADDMGLGKTVTAIALLAHAKQWPVS